MDKEKYLEDLKEIKDIMNRSTRFISLSGLSGVSTGIIAFAGSVMAYLLVFVGNDFLVHNAVEIGRDDLWKLIAIASVTLIFSILGAIYFTTRKAKKYNQSVWDLQTKKLIINLLIPLTTGGLLCLMFLFRGFLGFLPSLTLIFYGLALINASKYTLPEMRNLGLIQIFVGLLAFQFIEFALFFWAFGFGVVQMIYGLIIQKKY